MDGDAIEAQRHDLLARLVNSLGLERGDDSTTIDHENFETALEYAASRIATHSFGEPAERAIERRFDQLADKFSVHLHEDAARRLRSLSAAWRTAACNVRAGKRGVVVERVACMWSVPHSVLSLLFLLSQDPCAELEARAARGLEAAGSQDQADKDSPQSSGSSSWSIIQDGDADVDAAEQAVGGGGGAGAGADASASGSDSWGLISESGTTAAVDGGDASHLSVAWRREWEDALTGGHVSPGAHDFDELEGAWDGDGDGDDGDAGSVAVDICEPDVADPGHVAAARLATATPSPLPAPSAAGSVPAPAASGLAVSADSTSLSLSLSLSDETKGIEQQLSQRYELNPRALHRTGTDQSTNSVVPADIDTEQSAAAITEARASPSQDSARGQETIDVHEHAASLPSPPSMDTAAPELDAALGAWLAPHAHPATYESMPPKGAVPTAVSATGGGATSGCGADGAARLAPDALPSALPAEMLVRARALRYLHHGKGENTPGLQACLQTCAAASAAACAPTVLESEIVHDVVRLLQGLPAEHDIELELRNDEPSGAVANLRVGAGVAHLSDAALHAALSTFSQAVHDTTVLRSAIARINSAAAVAAASDAQAGLGATAEAFGSALAEFMGGFENLLACFERDNCANETLAATAAATTNASGSSVAAPTLLQLRSDLRRHLSRLHALRQLFDATNLFAGYENLSAGPSEGLEQSQTEADEFLKRSHHASVEARSRRRDNALRSRRILDACYAALQAELLLDANSTEDSHDDAVVDSSSPPAGRSGGPLGSLLALALLRDSMQPLLQRMGSWMADGTLGTSDQVGTVVQATSATGGVANDEFFIIPSSQRQRAHGRASASAKHDVGVGVRLAAGFLIHADAVPAFLAPLAEAVLRCGASVHLLGELAAPGAGQEGVDRALGSNAFAGFSAVSQPSDLRQGRQHGGNDPSGLPTHLRHRFDDALLAMMATPDSGVIPKLRRPQLRRALRTAYLCGVPVPPPPDFFYSSSYCRGGEEDDDDSSDELYERGDGTDTTTSDRNARKLAATLARTSAELLIWQTMLRPLVERHATVSRALVIALLHSTTNDRDDAADTSTDFELTLPTPGALAVTGSNNGLVPRLLEMRNVFFMARAELLDGYYTWLFSRLESGDAGWPNAQRLNARIRASLLACDTDSTDRLERRLRVVVGGSAARQPPSSLSALAVDSVTLTLDVPWPLCLVIDEGAVRKYQRVHALLAQLLRAKVGLEQYHHRVRQSMKRRHVRELARLRRRRTASGVALPKASEGKQGFAGASRAAPPVRPLPAQEVASVLGGAEHQLMLYLCEMQHFARRIHAHVASQATQAVWPALHARLCAIASHAHLRPDADAFGSTSGAIVSVEALHGLHCDYLDRVLEQTFLLPKQQALLNHIHKALSLALEFREALGLWMRARKRSERALWRREREQGLDDRPGTDSPEWSSSDSHSDEDEAAARGSAGGMEDDSSHLHLLELHKSFRQRLRWLVMVVSKGVKVAGEQSRLAPWLSELLLGLNFNEFVVRF